MPSGTPIKRLSKRLAQQEEKLAEQLDQDSKTQLSEIVNTQLEMDSATAEENFILDFQLGVRIIAECLTEGDEN